MLDFIINPHAGKGKSMKVRRILEKELNENNVEYCFHETNYEKHASALTRDLIKNGATDIIAVGGDGTVHEVLNGIDDFSNITFGIIGAGNGNDFVTSLKTPLNPIDALNVILEGKTKFIDYMDCAGVKGLNIIGAGIDVEILDRCFKSKILNGKLQYVFSLIISLFKFKYDKFKITKNGNTETKSALIVCVCNGSNFGGGIPICPIADISDGKLDYLIINEVRKPKIPKYFIKLMKGKILEENIVETEKLEEVKIDFDVPTTIQIDGELYKGLPFDVKIVKNKLRIYCN